MNSITKVFSVFLVGCLLTLSSLGGGKSFAGEIKVGLAEVDITPPSEYPLVGHFFPRKATGTKDPLKAKAVYLSDGAAEVVIVYCDLAGISVDLTTEVRQKASASSGIKKDHILLVATQCRNAPDYSLEMWHELSPDGPHPTTDAKPPSYVMALVEKISTLIGDVKKKAVPSEIRAGSTIQKKPVSFPRRIVLRDGTVRSGGNLKDPNAVKVAGPIDSEISLVGIKTTGGSGPTGVLSNFSLHANTSEGLEFSADFPSIIGESLKKNLGEQTISFFGVGCCGDLHHIDPEGLVENSTANIGAQIGATIVEGMGAMVAVKDQKLRVRSHTVQLPLYEVNPIDALKAGQTLWSIRLGDKVEFNDHLQAYRLVLLDQFHFDHPYVESHKHLKSGISRAWKGIGESFPLKIHLVTIGSEVAMIFLPGEVFVELGQSIKRGSPFRTTMVVQMAHACETSTIPTRAAYAQGGIEVLGCLLKPGAGERMVEATLNLIKETAREIVAGEKPSP